MPNNSKFKKHDFQNQSSHHNSEGSTTAPGRPHYKHTPKPPKKTWIPVVAGILKKGPKILVGKRPETHTLGGLWEFPGGKIEMGETPEEALARELREELAIEAEIGNLKIACTHSYGEVGILIMFYEVLFWKNEPKTKHHTDLEWIFPKELPLRNIPDANRKNLQRIYKAFNLDPMIDSEPPSVELDKKVAK